MKIHLSGRVIGHALFQPNPKDLPELELARVSLVLSSASRDSTKHTKAVLIVDKDAIHGDFILGRSVTITVQEYQGDLFQPGASADPTTGELPMGGPARAKGATAKH